MTRSRLSSASFRARWESISKRLFACGADGLPATFAHPSAGQSAIICVRILRLYARPACRVEIGDPSLDEFGFPRADDAGTSQGLVTRPQIGG